MWNTIRLSLVWAALGVSAQGLPMCPVSIVVQQTPEGSSDTLARLMAQRLQEQWSQPVIVEPGTARSTVCWARCSTPRPAST